MTEIIHAKNNAWTSVIYQTYKEPSQVPLTRRQRSITPKYVSLSLTSEQRKLKLMMVSTTRYYITTHLLPMIGIARNALHTQLISTHPSSLLSLLSLLSLRLYPSCLFRTTPRPHVRCGNKLRAPVSHNRVRIISFPPSSETRSADV